MDVVNPPTFAIARQIQDKPVGCIAGRAKRDEGRGARKPHQAHKANEGAHAGIVLAAADGVVVQVAFITLGR
jgi:hypothetical protein